MHADPMRCNPRCCCGYEDSASAAAAPSWDLVMHVISAHYPLHNPDLECFTGLPDQFPNAHSNIPSQNLVAIFRNPNKMILDLKNRVTAVSIVHPRWLLPLSQVCPDVVMAAV